MEKMTPAKLAVLAVGELEKLYPDIECSLKYKKPYEFLFSVRLSAQCTDARVNEVTKILFAKYPDLQSFADADIAELEECVKPCGFHHTKAKNIKDCAGQLINKFNGKVPDNMEDLLSLPGVGRKTANLILGDLYGKPAVVTDTHCIRISGRIGLTDNKEPEKVEKDLLKILPPEISNRFCHQLVQFGRDTCRARKPKCGECSLSGFCRYFLNNN